MLFALVLAVLPQSTPAPPSPPAPKVNTYLCKVWGLSFVAVYERGGAVTVYRMPYTAEQLARVAALPDCKDPIEKDSPR